MIKAQQRIEGKVNWMATEMFFDEEEARREYRLKAWESNAYIQWERRNWLDKMAIQNAIRELNS